MPRPQQNDPIQARHDAKAVGPLGVGGEAEQERKREGVSWPAGAGRGTETGTVLAESAAWIAEAGRPQVGDERGVAPEEDEERESEYRAPVEDIGWGAMHGRTRRRCPMREMGREKQPRRYTDS